MAFFCNQPNHVRERERDVSVNKKKNSKVILKPTKHMGKAEGCHSVENIFVVIVL